MKSLCKYKGQLLITLILLLIILLTPFQNYMERNLLSNRMNYPEDLIGIIQENEGVLSIPDTIEATTLTSEDFYYKKGTYEATFSLKAYSEGSTVEVCDPLYLNSDNTSGMVLASATVPVGEEEVHLTFSVTDSIQCIQFRINSCGALDFNSLYLRSQNGLYRDPFIYAGLLILISALLLVYRTRHTTSSEVCILLTFTALWSSLPLFLPWLLDGHDLYFHYGRLFSLSKDILHEAFPVRIHPEMLHGFGYLSPIFYPELFLYPFALLGALGLSPIGCYQLLLISTNLATSGVSYYAFSRLFRSRQLGLIASFLYTLSSYRLINLYTRAAIGEVLASIFLPLLLLGMYQLFLGDSRKWIISVIAFTGLIQSHLISTELAIGFGVIFGLFYITRLKEKKRLMHLLLAAGSTVLLNIWYLIPLLDHMRYPVYAMLDTRKLSVYTLYTPQVFDVGMKNPAGVAVFSGPFAGEMPYSIGFILLAGILLFLYSCFQKKEESATSYTLPNEVRPSRRDMHYGVLGKYAGLGKWCLALGLFSLYVSSVYFPWEKLQSISFLNRFVGKIQFPSRFLPFAVLFLCVVSAIGIYEFFQKEELRRFLFLFCGIWTACSAGLYFSNYFEQAEPFVSWNNQMDHVLDTDYLYLLSPNGSSPDTQTILNQDIAFLSSEGVTLQNCSRTGGTYAAFTYSKPENSSDAYVDISLSNYPSFHAYYNQNLELETTQGDGLRLRVLLPEAVSGTVTVRLKQPVIYRIGDLISLLTLLSLITFTVLQAFLKNRYNSKLHYYNPQ